VDTLNFFRVAALDISQRKIKEQELSDGRVELEKRVKEKTSDLLQVVNLLRNEIEQRKQADIELQKRSKELEQSEKKYRTLVEVSPNAVCVAVEDKIVFVNNTTVKILNAKNSEELKGKSVWQFIHPDSVDTIKSRLNQFKDSKKEAEVAEVKLIRCDGTFIDVGGTSALIDYEGKPGRLIIFQDISVRKKQEASLKKIKSRLVEAQRIAHLGNWDWDIVNNSFWLSDECYRILGIDPQYFDGNFEALNKLIHPDDRQGVKETNDQAIKNCKSFNLEFRVIRPDGVIRSIHKRGEVQCVNNQAVRLLGTIQDITEQKKAESQLILSRQKLRTLAAKMEMIEEQERRRIASDLHDSIGQILAFATRELKYMRKNLPKKYSDALLEIAEELDKAVVQARTLSFDLSPSILYDIGFEIAVEDLLEKFSSERKINYQFENDEHPKPLTIPLKILLYRSIRELLMNIAKHANAKDVKVSLIKEGINIKVIVEDNGKGFDVAEIDEGEKTKGFGLFNIRERIEHLGGKFKIESIKGKGTKTTIIAPLTIDTVNNFEKEEEVQGYHK
jgi:PAS domain S-box-containing protein